MISNALSRVKRARAESLGTPSKPSYVLEILSHAEDHLWFKNLVCKFLPESADEIISMPRTEDKLESFCQEFRKRFFELDENYVVDSLAERELNECSPFSELRAGIPCQMMGIDLESLHDLWESYGVGIGLISLTAGTEDVLWGDPGLRYAWMEEARAIVPDEVLRELPEEGYHPQVLREACWNNSYRPLSMSVDWVCQITGNHMLDTSHYDDMHWSNLPEWDWEVIEILTTHYHQATKAWSRMSKFRSWLEADPASRFTRVVRFLGERTADLDQQAIIDACERRFRGWTDEEAERVARAAETKTKKGTSKKTGKKTSKKTGKATKGRKKGGKKAAS